MNWKNTIFLLILFSLVYQTYAQDSKKNKVLLINPIGILATVAIEDQKNMTITYEHEIIPELSGSVSINYSNIFVSSTKDNLGNETAKLKYSGYGFLPEIRHYPYNAPRGFFIGAFGKFMIAKETYFEREKLIGSDDGYYVGAGGKIGYKFGKKVVFEPSLLFGYGKFSDFNKNIVYTQNVVYPKTESTFWGIEIKMGLMF